MSNYEMKTPYILILFESGHYELGEMISFSLEENGIPFRLIEQNKGRRNGPKAESDLGVIVFVNERNVRVYVDHYKKDLPLFKWERSTSMDDEMVYLKLRTIGDNIAGIVHKKPFKEINYGI